MGFFSSRRESVEQVIDRLVKERKTESIEQELRKFDPRKLSAKDKETWHLHWGIAAFRRGDRPEAFRRFSEALAVCPESDQIRFSLGQEFEAKGNSEKMAELFRSCRFPQISSRHLLAASRYCYLWNQIDDAVSLLQPLFNAYFELGVADDHFLYMRGLPFFGETWSYHLCYSILRRDFQEIEELTRRAKANLRDYDFDRLVLFLECSKSGDFLPWMQKLEAELGQADARFPNGYQRIQLAALKSLREPTSSHLAVTLNERDFPWLGDVLLIHQARVANVVGDHSEEERLINTFFQRQPLLFEPDHAANFAFVEYQENLKPPYQRSKQA